jgi:hypothetical protein
MGALTPKPESLRDIVERFKDQLSKMTVNRKNIDPNSAPPIKPESGIGS